MTEIWNCGRDRRVLNLNKNDLTTYLHDRLLDLQMLQKLRSGRDRHFFVSHPKPFLALSNNAYDLSLMLKRLDSNILRVLRALRGILVFSCIKSTITPE